METPPYTRDFFAEQRSGSAASARQIVPIVLEMTRPRSVIDVGCGIGTWLEVFAEYGIDDFLGIDGEYVDSSQLLIPPERFLARDLRQPVIVGREFDLAVSLEVAEHLPEEVARRFVESLARLAPAVLFSAAIPGQGGVDHLNEQWPQYWAEMFFEHDFVVFDVIRPRFWHHPDVAWWYAQNTLLFLKRPDRSESGGDHTSDVNALVHPRLYEGIRHAVDDLTTRQLIERLPRALQRTLTWRLPRPKDTDGKHTLR